MFRDETVQAWPLSSPQRDIWYDQMLHPDLPLYNIGGYLDVQGPVAAAVLTSAIRALIRRHDALRTVITAVASEQPQQRFAENLAFQLPRLDFSAEAEPASAALTWMEQEFVRPFDLAGEALFRCQLLEIDDQHFFINLVFHHLIIDGWGISIFARSLGETYSALLEGEPAPEEAPSYLRFIEDDLRYLGSSRYENQREYWREKCRNLPELRGASALTTGPDRDTMRNRRRILKIPRDLYERLTAVAAAFMSRSR